jgi:hypothetical protein
MAPKTYEGSCHCGAVKFSAKLDLEGQGTTKCNCTVCLKTRSWEALTKPEDFQVTQGEDQLTAYLFGRKTIPHYFCKHCGTHTHMTGAPPGLGETVFVHINCLDNIDPREIGDVPVKFIDNLNDKVGLSSFVDGNHLADMRLHSHSRCRSILDISKSTWWS